MTMVATFGETAVRLDLRPPEPQVAEACQDQLHAYLRPRADELLNAVFAGPRPEVIEIAFRVREEDYDLALSEWHTFIPARRGDGLRTLERVLVAAASQAMPDATWKEWHDRACHAIASHVDETFICAMELQ